MVAQAFKAEGHAIELVGIVPLFPEIPSTSYIVQIYSTWFNQMPTYSEAIAMVVDKLFELLPATTLRYVSSGDICHKQADIHCRQEDIIMNEIGYQPLYVPYHFVE